MDIGIDSSAPPACYETTVNGHGQVSFVMLLSSFSAQGIRLNIAKHSTPWLPPSSLILPNCLRGNVRFLFRNRQRPPWGSGHGLWIARNSQLRPVTARGRGKSLSFHYWQASLVWIRESPARGRSVRHAGWQRGMGPESDIRLFVGCNHRKVFEGHRKEVGMRLDAWTVYFEDWKVPFLKRWAYVQDHQQGSRCDLVERVCARNQIFDSCV